MEVLTTGNSQQGVLRVYIPYPLLGATRSTILKDPVLPSPCLTPGVEHGSILPISTLLGLLWD